MPGVSAGGNSGRGGPVGDASGMAARTLDQLREDLVATLSGEEGEHPSSKDPLSATIDSLAGLMRETLDVRAVAAVPDVDLVSVTRSLETLNRAVEAVTAVAHAQVRVRSPRSAGTDGFAGAHGCRSAAEFLQVVTGRSGAALARGLRLTEELLPAATATGGEVEAHFSVVAEAVFAGRIPLDMAQAIVSGLASCVGRIPAEALSWAEASLVEIAGEPGMHAELLKVHVAAHRGVVDQDGAAPDDGGEPHRQRSVNLGRVHEGLVSLSGKLLPETAAQLQRLFEAHWDSASNTKHADPRSAPQKRHDLLTSMLNAAAAAADAPTIGGMKPGVLVSVAAADLMRFMEAGAGVGGLAWIDGINAPVSLRVAEHLACAEGIQRVFLDSQGRITQLGTPQRLFNAHQRRAISLRDGGCVIPGCMVPAGWCEIHHVREASRGGPTHTDNGVALCWFHHRTIDTGGWSIRMNRGIPEIKAPLWLDHDQQWRPGRNPRRL